MGPAVTLEVDEVADATDEGVARVRLTDAPAGQPRHRKLASRLLDGRWLELRLRASPGARITVRDPLGRTQRVGNQHEPAIYRVDFFAALLDAPPEVLGRAAGDLVVTEVGIDVAFDVEDASGSERAHLSSAVPVGPERALLAQLSQVAGAPLEWAAEYPGEAPGPHPLVLLLADRDGSPVSLDMSTLPRQFHVREVQLIAIATRWSRVLGRCPQCTDISGIYGEEPCDREQRGYDISIYAARTGRRVAKKKLRGALPPKCAPRHQTTDLFAAAGEVPFSALVEWVGAFAQR